MCLWREMHVCVPFLGSSEKDFGLLNLNLKVVVSHCVWALGTEIWSSARVASALNTAISLALL